MVPDFNLEWCGKAKTKENLYCGNSCAKWSMWMWVSCASLNDNSLNLIISCCLPPSLPSPPPKAAAAAAAAATTQQTHPLQQLPYLSPASIKYLLLHSIY